MTDIVVRCVTVRLGTLSSIPMILAPARVTGTKFLERSDQLKDFSKLGHQLPRSSHLGSNEVEWGQKSNFCKNNDVSRFLWLGKAAHLVGMTKNALTWLKICQLMSVTPKVILGHVRSCTVMHEANAYHMHIEAYTLSAWGKSVSLIYNWS